MTLNELFIAAYGWVLAHQTGVLVGTVAVPVLGTLGALAGRGGNTDEDGRVIASAVAGFALVLLVLEALGIWVAHSLLDKNILDAPIVVIGAPVACAGLCLMGIRWVFPLSELTSVKTFTDFAVFFVACLVLLWVLSKFRGWGVVFLGGILELGVILVVTGFFLRRLYRRAFALDGGNHRG